MKTIKLFVLGIFVLFFIQACFENTESISIKQSTNTNDTLTIGCLGSYEINPLDNKEKINQLYGKEKIKNGHWITFGFSVTKNVSNKATRIKLEEGYYKRNKKNGFWKFYNDDGSFKDSVKYINDVAVTSE